MVHLGQSSCLLFRVLIHLIADQLAQNHACAVEIDVPWPFETEEVKLALKVSSIVTIPRHECCREQAFDF